jgi:hypothetical protein
MAMPHLLCLTIFDDCCNKKKPKHIYLPLPPLGDGAITKRCIHLGKLPPTLNNMFHSIKYENYYLLWKSLRILSDYSVHSNCELKREKAFNSLIGYLAAFSR